MPVPVQHKGEILQRLKRNSSAIQGFGVEKLGLFGSFSQNAQHINSDIDLLVDFEPGKKTIDNLLGLSEYLHALLGRKVELVTRKSLSPYIGPEILKTVEDVNLRA